MSQNSKVVHWPEKALEAAELQPLIREGIMVLRPLGEPMSLIEPMPTFGIKCECR
jgi:hypothetical protein